MINKLVFSIASLFMLLNISACSTNQGTNTTETEISANPTWQFEQQVRATGKVILSKPIELSFSIPGQVVEMLVEEGYSVNEGDMIARLDTWLLEQEISQEEAALDVANANLKRVLVGPNQIDLIQAENDLIAAEAFRPISSAQSTMQVADIVSAQARLDYFESLPLPEEVAMAQADIDRAQTSVDSAKVRLEKSILAAPINGTVIDVYINAYEHAGVGQPVLKLSDLNDLSIEVRMDEIDIADLSLGDTAIISFDALPGITAQAIITAFTPNLDIRETHDFNVELKLLEVPKGLRWGMSAEASFE